MKHSTLVTLFGLTLAVVLLASSNGVAEEQGRDRTGAPGSDPVCTSCHSSAGASVTASFEMLEWNTEEPVTSYVPGEDYIVRMVISGGDASLNYGVQATAVFANGDNAGSFQTATDNVQLENVNGRHIVEHNAPSAINSFEARWTAPAAGSGDAEFYMSGLAVNGNGATSGDTYTGATLIFPESGTNEVAEGNLEAWARPVWAAGQWTWTSPNEGRLVVADATGRILQSTSLNAGQSVNWTGSDLTIVSFVSDEGQRQSWKLSGR